MAEHLTLFSERITEVTREEAAWLNRQIETILFDGRRILAAGEPPGRQDEQPCEVPRFVAEALLEPAVPAAEWVDRDWECTERGFETRHCPDGRTYEFYSERDGDVGHLAHVWHKFLRTFRPDGCLSATWARICSKPQVGAFGGGAVFVTAERIAVDDSHSRVDRWGKRFERLGPASQ